MHHNSITYEAMCQWLLEVVDPLDALGNQLFEPCKECFPVRPTRIRTEQVQKSALLPLLKEPDLACEDLNVVPADDQIVVGLAGVLLHAALPVGQRCHAGGMAFAIDSRRNPEVDE